MSKQIQTNNLSTEVFDTEKLKTIRHKIRINLKEH